VARTLKSRHGEEVAAEEVGKKRAQAHGCSCESSHLPCMRARALTGVRSNFGARPDRWETLEAPAAEDTAGSTTAAPATKHGRRRAAAATGITGVQIAARIVMVGRIGGGGGGGRRGGGGGAGGRRG
jgi:hypothetical protein